LRMRKEGQIIAVTSTASLGGNSIAT